MQQLTKYRVEELGTDQVSILSSKDANLVDSYVLTSLPFYPTKYRVDLSFYDFNGMYIETIKDLRTYTVQGIIQKGKVNQIVLDPVQDALNQGYKGDVDVKYDFYNNMFSPDNNRDINLFVTEISTDRTELRSQCLDLTNSDITSLVESVHSKLNLQNYFSEIYLEFVDDNVKVVGTNIMTEVIDGQMYVTFKLYEPLPETVVEKSKFNVLENVGDPVKFRVIREVEVIPERASYLRGPNFSLTSEESAVNVTEYLNYEKLFSLPVNESKNKLRELARGEGCQIGIDFSNFSNFIHFSSAAERLLNFKYKMQLLERYEEIKSNFNDSSSEYLRYQELITGILLNFDEYEQFLYYEYHEKAWPKVSQDRPYKNKPSYEVDQWWNSIYSEAESYDETNKDILIAAIPFSIREDSRNEPFVVFVHMIGQHFDRQWLYAKALADKYKADNRMNFGISKDLVREAIQDLGITLSSSNQNLESLFNSFGEDGKFIPGKETSVKSFYRISDFLEISGNPKVDFQPTTKEDYLGEVYKRIYHNLPLLLKSKGTERGLRALINCFGIPDDILQIEVRGGVKVDRESGGYFGPIDSVTSSLAKVRTDSLGQQSPLQYNVLDGTGSLTVVPVLSRYVSVQSKGHQYSDDQHQVLLGFSLGGQANKYLKSKLSEENFDYDDIIGDARNHKENYGGAIDNKRNQLLDELKGELRDPKGNLFRTPSAIIRLVRYFDSILFKSVKEFVAARANVSTGAIVEDNVLHRNRYVGVDLDTEHVRVETVLDLMSITGSEGGHLADRPVNSKAPTSKSFTVGTTTVNVTGSLPVYEASWSTGLFTGSKPVFDNSPSYNGEFQGSVIEVSTGEVLDNPYKRGGSNATVYDVGAMFLDLPSPLLCDLVMSLENGGEVHSYYKSVQQNITRGYSTQYTFNTEFAVLPSGSILKAPSESVALGTRISGSKYSLPSELYIGWTSGSTETGSSYYNYGKTVDTGTQQERIVYGTNHDHHTVQYAQAKEHGRFRVKVENLSKFGAGAYYYYGNRGFVISYVIEGKHGNADNCIVSNPGGVINAMENWNYTIGVSLETGCNHPTHSAEDCEFSECDDTHCYITINPTGSNVHKHTEDGTIYGIIIATGHNLECKNITSYGVTAIGQEKHPFLLNNTFIDADWKFNYSPELEKSGSWNYDNNSKSHGWELLFESGSSEFTWRWLK